MNLLNEEQVVLPVFEVVLEDVPALGEGQLLLGSGLDLDEPVDDVDQEVDG